MEHCPLRFSPPPKPSSEDYKRLASAINHLDQATGSKHQGSLHKCFDTECRHKTSRKTCYGVIGCSWCEFEYDSNNKLKNISSKPFCTDENLCFSGILSGYNPYTLYSSSVSPKLAGLNQGGKFYEELDSRSGLFRTSTGTPVGPIAAAILGVFLLITGTIFCYHTNARKLCGRSESAWSADSILSRTRSRVTIGRGGDNLFAAEDDDNCDDGAELREINGVLDDGNVENEMPKPNSVMSPYRMNPSYRRPNNNGTDSDQGYSTFECSTVTPLERCTEKGNVYRIHDSSAATASHIDIDSAEHSDYAKADHNTFGDSDNSILPYTSSASARERLRRFDQKKTARGRQCYIKHTYDLLRI